jgi:hypothetical protein
MRRRQGAADARSRSERGKRREAACFVSAERNRTTRVRPDRFRSRQRAKHHADLGCPMRTLRLAASLLLTLAGTAVLAQNDSSIKSRKLFAEYFEKCMNDWDTTTHMTKKDWERTCRRLADQRVKFRLEHGFK